MATSLETSSTPYPPIGPSPSQVHSSPRPEQPQPNPQTQTQPQTQPFPPPQTFTFLPQLYTIISRLTPLQTPSHSHQNGTPATTSASRASRSPTLTRRPATTEQSASNDGANLTLTQTRSRDETIETKDLPGLVYPLRQQIERAKEVVRGLPDVGRSVEEQEAEMRELEGRIGGLKARLGSLGQVAAGERGVVREDVVMLGVEG